MATRSSLRLLRITLGLLLHGSVLAAALPSQGMLQVTVVDEAGRYVSDAHVYIYGKQTNQLADARDTNGVADFNLPRGAYRVYSAVTRKEGDYIDHFASLEAFVEVNNEDNTSVVLTLRKMQNPIFYLSKNVRKKIGLDENLSKYLY